MNIYTQIMQRYAKIKQAKKNGSAGRVTFIPP